MESSKKGLDIAKCYIYKAREIHNIMDLQTIITFGTSKHKRKTLT